MWEEMVMMYIYETQTIVYVTTLLNLSKLASELS